MKKQTKRITSALFAVLVCMNLGAVTALAQGNITVSQPQSEYMDYLSNPKEYGIVPPPATVKGGGTRSGLRTAREALPQKYDLRDVTGLPPIRNQGQEGICWAFSSSASLESSLLKKGLGDEFLTDENLLFSEKHMGLQCSADNENPWGFDRAPDGGGNNYYAQAYYSRGDGPVLVRDYIEGQPHIVSPADEYYTKPAGEVKKIAGDVVFVPDMPRNLIGGVASADRQAFIRDMKETVLQYGAVSTSYYSDMGSLVTNLYMNHETNAYYYYNGYRAQNHAVAVVGWDDAYPKENFLTQPEGDGAWLIRNSWGADQFDGGYMWISYYDTCFGTYSAAFQAADDEEGYDHIYQYDPFGYAAWTYLHDGEGVPVTSQWAANVFPIRDTKDEVTSVGVFVCQANTTCDVAVKVFPDEQAFSAHDMTDSDVLVSKTFEKPGFYRIALPQAVSLEAGGMFAACVRYTTRDQEYVYVPIECNFTKEGDDGVRQNASAAPGQSFLYWDDTDNWQDVWNDEEPDVSKQMNFNIKAYTQYQISYGEIGIDTQAVTTERENDSIKVTVPVTKSIEQGVYGVKLLMVPVFAEGETGKPEIKSVTITDRESTGEAVFTLTETEQAKLFLWDGFDTMRPLAEGAEILLEQ